MTQAEFAELVELVDTLRTFGRFAWAVCAVTWAVWAVGVWWVQRDTTFVDPALLRAVSKTAFKTALFLVPVGLLPAGSWQSWWFITSTVFLPMHLMVVGTWLGLWGMAVTMERRRRE